MELKIKFVICSYRKDDVQSHKKKCEIFTLMHNYGSRQKFQCTPPHWTPKRGIENVSKGKFENFKSWV